MATTRMAEKPLKLLPPALKPGDTIGIIAPASADERSLLQAGREHIEQLGYKISYLPSILERELYFAGSVDRRINEFHEMFRRDDVSAILCARGGYGCNYLLPLLDLDLIQANPKLFIGYSDITSIATYVGDQIGLITVHGPMLTRDFARGNGVDLASWNAVLTGASDYRYGSESDLRPLVDGEAEGELYGGCLSMLVASLGTPYEIQTGGKLLFLEDVSERPYRIDRMLMHLKLAGKLDGIKGLIFGEMLDCDPPADQTYTLKDVILRITRDLNVPIAFGLRSGHVAGANITLPLGVRARLAVSSDRAELGLLEPAVQAC